MIDLLYNVLGELAKRELPIVFKGALVLKQIMETETQVITSRMTRDIDLDWVDENMTTENMRNEIEVVMEELGRPEYVVDITRDFKEGGGTAGFLIKDGNGVKIFSIDISNQPNLHSTEYFREGGIQFLGSTREKIYVDKISALSTHQILRRCKDMYDLYLLSHLEDFHLSIIQEVMYEEKTELGDFSVFLWELDKLSHAYSKMKNIINKPEFEVVYKRVRDFCTPFMVPGREDVEEIWFSTGETWTYSPKVINREYIQMRNTCIHLSKMIQSEGMSENVSRLVHDRFKQITNLLIEEKISGKEYDKLKDILYECEYDTELGWE